jgi:hypothetical protein
MDFGAGMDFDPGDPSVADLDGDGIFDSVQFDTDHDGRIDTEYTRTPDGLGHLFLDTDADGFADSHYLDTAPGTDQPLTLTDPVTPAAPEATATTLPAFDADSVMSSDTQALRASINLNLGFAADVWHSQVDPGSVSADDLAAAQEHANTVAGNLGWMQGQVTADAMHNDIVNDQAQREALWSQRESDAEVTREADLAEYRAGWTVWDSEQERGA